MKKNAFDVVCFGEVLWDLLPSGALPGGAPMNVAYHLKKLGLEPALISRTGMDSRGDELLNILERNQLAIDFIQRDPEHLTGIVEATIQSKHEVRSEIIEPVAWDFIETRKNFQDLVSASSFFIFGSLAARNEVSRKTLMELLDAAPKKVLDINLRPPHFTKDLADRLLHSADLLKLNEHELPLIASWYSNLLKEEDQLRFLQDNFSIPCILLTKGKAGALVCSGGKISSHPGYQVKVADTVGSGDAFLAAFLFGMNKGDDFAKALAFANALGAFIASKKGACPDYELKEVIAFMEKPSLEKTTP
ncbi:MAG: carbohydrate kinase family protein [Flavisolibacter sp.]